VVLCVFFFFKVIHSKGDFSVVEAPHTLGPVIKRFAIGLEALKEAIVDACREHREWLPHGPRIVARISATTFDKGETYIPYEGALLEAFLMVGETQQVPFQWHYPDD
jgi:hypothetical protein